MWVLRLHRLSNNNRLLLPLINNRNQRRRTGVLFAGKRLG
ncbi:hypothetical protein Goshw_021236 [Gossypium schwendimanii]|uniref:Uncharacterized protein n=1 Tax=Gossypium schwendimanii TaxID=34291 RepID=A0A7J9KZA7_GOSSC|nr:hypothetical protein [Gossypium schwendimanii]